MSTSILHAPHNGSDVASSATHNGDGALASLWETLRVWRHRAQGRRDLRAYLSFQRAVGGGTPWGDLGVTHGELLEEARKPFWRE